MRYEKELKAAVKSSFGSSLGVFIGLGILPYFIFKDIYSDVRRIFICGIGSIISFLLIAIIYWILNIAKFKKNNDSSKPEGIVISDIKK